MTIIHCLKCGAAMARPADRCRKCRMKYECIGRKLKYAKKWAKHAKTPECRTRNAEMVASLERQLAES